MSPLIRHFLSALILPPLNCLLIASLGLILIKKWFRLGVAITVFALGTLYFLSTPYVSSLLLLNLEKNIFAVRDVTAPQAHAIVVLGCGIDLNAPEYAGNDFPSSCAQQRMTYAAYLFNKSGLPILVTGGSSYGQEHSEASVMKKYLESFLTTPVKWTEENSLTTAENAKFTSEILSSNGITAIYLVTQAWHMPRAKRVFEQAGFAVTPAATAFADTPKLELEYFIPDASSLLDSYKAFHEGLGMVWYWMKSS